jgi:hypothetical protein
MSIVDLMEGMESYTSPAEVAAVEPQPEAPEATTPFTSTIPWTIAMTYHHEC